MLSTPRLRSLSVCFNELRNAIVFACFLLVSKYLLLKYLKIGYFPKWCGIPLINVIADAEEHVMKSFVGTNLGRLEPD